MKCSITKSCTSFFGSTGVTVLLTPPQPTGVNTNVMFTAPFEEEVFPSDAMQTTNPHATGACWTKADDELVTRYGKKKELL